MDLFRQHTINTPKQPLIPPTALSSEQGKKRDLSALTDNPGSNVGAPKAQKPRKVAKYDSNELSFSFPPPSIHSQRPPPASSLRESDPAYAYSSPMPGHRHNPTNTMGTPYAMTPQPYGMEYQDNVREECRTKALFLSSKLQHDIHLLTQFTSSIGLDVVASELALEYLYSANRSLACYADSLQKFTGSFTPMRQQPQPMPAMTVDDRGINWAAATLSQFTLLQTIGTGTFGRVRLCKHVSSGEYFCMKILQKQTIVQLKQQQHIQSERDILLHCRHPNIVRLFSTFQDQSNVYFVMEYVSGGELFTTIKRNGRLDPQTTKFYAKEIVMMIEYMHGMGVVHRDLKPENLLLDQLGHLKLTDFGFAKVVHDCTFTMCGTPEYIAPEIIQGKGHGRGVDWWCLGILVFEMLVGHPPFQGDDNCSVFEKILDAKLEVPSYVDPHAKSLISSLLVVDITNRLGCMKGGVNDIKSHPYFRDISWDVDLSTSGPICPKTGSPGDTSNFFVDPEDEPSQLFFNGDQNLFSGF